MLPDGVGSLSGGLHGSLAGKALWSHRTGWGFPGQFFVRARSAQAPAAYVLAALRETGIIELCRTWQVHMTL